MPVPRYTTLISISQFRPIYVYFKPPSPHIIGNSILNILNLDLDHPHQNKNGGKKELGNLSIFRCYFKSPAPVEVGSRSSHYFCTGFIHPFGSFFPKLLKPSTVIMACKPSASLHFCARFTVFSPSLREKWGGETTTWAHHLSLAKKKLLLSIGWFSLGILTCHGFIRIPKKNQPG